MSAIDFDAVMAKYKKNDKDTGSTSVQIIGLTSEIVSLQSHFGVHPKDNSGRRGILMKVSNRRKLLDYLKRKDTETYSKLIVDLGLRK